MLILKDIKPSEIQMMGAGTPQLECTCCHKTAKPKTVFVSAKDWLIAAHQCGWRRVEGAMVEFESVCPECVAELEVIESDELTSAKA